MIKHQYLPHPQLVASCGCSLYSRTVFAQPHEYSHKVITACPSLWVRIWFEIRDVSHQVLFYEEVHQLWRIKMSFKAYFQVKWTSYILR